MGTQTLMVCANSDMWMWCILGKVDLTPDFCSGNLVVHLTFDILFDKFLVLKLRGDQNEFQALQGPYVLAQCLVKILWCEQWTRDHTAQRYRCSPVLGAEQRNLRGRRGQCSPAVITNELNWWPQLPPSICPYNHHNHLHSLTAFPCTPHLSPFRILSHTLHNTVSDQTQALLHNSHNTCSLPRHQLQAWRRSVSISSPRSREHKLQQAIMLQQFQVSPCSSCTCIELWIMNPASYRLNSYFLQPWKHTFRTRWLV